MHVGSYKVLGSVLYMYGTHSLFLAPIKCYGYYMEGDSAPTDSGFGTCVGLRLGLGARGVGVLSFLCTTLVCSSLPRFLRTPRGSNLSASNDTPTFS